MKYILMLLFSGVFLSCNSAVNRTENHSADDQSAKVESTDKILPGAYQVDRYLPMLKGKKVGVVANHTSLIGETHLVDTLLSLGITIERVFSPEHGFRGNIDAGAHIKDSVDPETGLEIASLYGENRKPSAEMMEGIEIMLFDIQDVGVRFYTYISTMQYTMESAAEISVPFIILDRPNPLGHYVDGPVLDMELRSFVGLNPIPTVHGMTVGEFGQMIDAEGWLENGKSVDLTVIPVENYDHSMLYSLPVKPSPNLPNDQAIALYPSVCLFEGTTISVGRGTYEAFQVIGHPSFEEKYDFSFTPESIEGMASNPKYKDITCYGLDLRNVENPHGFTLKYLIEFYNNYKGEAPFFNNYFPKLAGNYQLQKQIENGLSEAEIKATWQPELNEFKKLRKKYLLYPDYD